MVPVMLGREGRVNKTKVVTKGGLRQSLEQRTITPCPGIDISPALASGALSKNPPISPKIWDFEILPVLDNDSKTRNLTPPPPPCRGVMITRHGGSIGRRVFIAFRCTGVSWSMSIKCKSGQAVALYNVALTLGYDTPKYGTSRFHQFCPTKSPCS